LLEPYENFNGNRRIRVPKKELDDLMAELFEDDFFLNVPSTYVSVLIMAMDTKRVNHFRMPNW
jgi:hypothetical protein